MSHNLDAAIRAAIRDTVREEVADAIAEHGIGGDPLLGPKDAAAHLGVSQRQFYRLRDELALSPDLKHGRCVRYRKSNLDRAVRKTGFAS